MMAAPLTVSACPHTKRCMTQWGGGGVVPISCVCVYIYIMYICIYVYMYIYIYTHYLIIYAHSLRLAQTRSDSLRLAYISHFRAAVFWKITLKESSTLCSIVRRITFLFVFCFFFCFFYCFSSMLLFYLPPNRLIMVLGFVVLRRGL